MIKDVVLWGKGLVIGDVVHIIPPVQVRVIHYTEMMIRDV